MPSIEYKGQLHGYPSTGDGVEAWQRDQARVASGKAPKFSLRALNGRSMRQALRNSGRAASNGH